MFAALRPVSALRKVRAMTPRLAITREPGSSLKDCISCHPMRHTINITKAREQHKAYREALKDLGLEVLQLPRDDILPDSCFVEDNAVVHGRKAIICRPAKESRRGEVTAVEEALKGLVKTRRAVEPATVEGGDVIHLDGRLVSGQTQRTNAAGIRQMGEWLEVGVTPVEAPDIMHLKSYATYLGKNTVISTRLFAKHPAFSDMSVIVVPDSEGYAADTLAIGDAVLMAKGHRQSQRLVQAAGFSVVPVDVGEFAKCDGAITCLSILI